MFYITLCVILLTVFILRTLLYLKQGVKRKLETLGLPSFREVPLVGDSLKALKLFGRAPGLPISFYAIQTIEGCKQLFKGKKIFTISLALGRYVIFSTPQSIEVLLSDKVELQKPPEYDLVKPALSTGLITCDLKKWRKQRKYLTPVFHFRLMEKAQEIMCEQSEILVDILKKEVGKDYTVINEIMQKCTLDIIAENAFGYKFKSQNSSTSPFIEAVNKAEACIFERIVSPWLWPDWIFSLTKTGRAHDQHLKYIRSVCFQLLEQNKRELAECQKEWTAEEIELKSKSSNFMQLLLLYNILKEEEPLTDEEIYGESITFLAAGYETTGLTMSWVLYNLGLYPELLSKVHSELDDIFQEDRERIVTSADLKEMRYLECVIKESLRLYPPVPLIARHLQNDLLVDGALLPKGTTCIVMIGSVHRDPSEYPNPEVFDPDRFLETNRNPYAFIPFSGGPRNCIGQKYAMIELKICLAYILRIFSVTSLDPRDKVLMIPELVNQPCGPIRVKFDLR